MIIGHHMQKYRDEITYHLRELVKIRSVMDEPLPGKPFGEGVDRALTYMLELARSFGFDVCNVDGYAGHAEYGSGDELAAMLVHLDTVHEGDGWTYPPFGGELRDGKMYGRGASDNKGPAVVALYALRALREAGIEPSRKIRVIFGTNEESGMSDMDYYFSKELLPELAFAPDAGYPIYHIELGNMSVVFSQPKSSVEEGPALRVVSLQGGNSRTLVPDRCTAVLSLEGISEEEWGRWAKDPGSVPSYITIESAVVRQVKVNATGVSGDEEQAGSSNAVANMIHFLSRLPWKTDREEMLTFLHERIGFEGDGQSLGIACSDEVSGGLVVFLRIAEWDDTRTEVNCNIRYPVTVDGDDLVARLRELAGSYSLDAQVVRHLRPVYVHPGHPVIERLSRAYEKMTGWPVELLRMGAGTYCRKLHNNGVAFGAGLPGGIPTNVHQADEFIVIDDLMRHAEICLQGLYELAVE